MEAETHSEKLASIASNAYVNAQKEIKNYNINLLNNHRYDNILNYIEQAVERGFPAVEWIDFMGCGVMDKYTAINWAKDTIKDQNLEGTVEPYYNSCTKRLGIVLSRKALRKYNLLSEDTFIALPLELRDCMQL